eukprot:364933-Chlamydomonas_euryale.AAC.24
MISMRPNARMASSTMRCAASAAVTSAATWVARPPAPCTATAVASATFPSMSHTTTAAPCSASNLATAAPIPRPAPACECGKATCVHGCANGRGAVALLWKGKGLGHINASVPKQLAARGCTCPHARFEGYVVQPPPARARMWTCALMQPFGPCCTRQQRCR